MGKDRPNGGVFLEKDFKLNVNSCILFNLCGIGIR